MANQSKEQMIAAAFGDALEEDGFAPDGFTIIGELDRGGMSIVYLAEQQEPQREVALKIILPRYSNDEQICERFQREGHTMAALDHPGILPIYQVGEWERLSFIAMKLATAGSLQDLLKKETPSIHQTVDWMISVGEAVHYAHQSGVLHRDLKPGNLLFDHSGAIYVSDFGIAKTEFNKNKDLTLTNTLIGTPHYLAPEAASGEVNGGSVASDLYGLGAILYQCLTDKIPYSGTTSLAAQLRAIVEQDLAKIKKLNPETPKDLCIICEKALSKRSEDRYPSVIDFVADLKRWKSGLHIMARPVGLVEKVWLWSKRYPITATLSVLLLFTLLFGSVVFAINYKKRGDLLHEKLIESAKSERRDREPNYRKRVFQLLKDAHDIKDSTRIREEAIAVMAQWDISEDQDTSVKWVDEESPSPYSIKEINDQISVIDKKTNQAHTTNLSGVLRHPPTFSADGRFVALVRGNRIEIVIYDIIQKNTFSIIPLENWPKKIEFLNTGEVIKVTLENETASLLNLHGHKLLENFHQSDNLTRPIGLSLWKRNSLNPTEVRPYGGEVSPNEEFIATTSAIGVHIWDSKLSETVDFYEVENQIIDAPTDAWWINNRQLLTQVPGAQEILEIDHNGKVAQKIDFPRIPGSKILDIFSDGNWLVELKNEDGSSAVELWKQGDSSLPLPYTTATEEHLLIQGRVILFKKWALTLPANNHILKAFMIENGTKILALTTDYDIYEWDLAVLTKKLEHLGL